jgi:hypothetical protein
MVAADRLQRTMRRSAGTHVVLGMDLEKAALLSFIEDRRQMLVLEAAARKAAYPKRRKAG